MTDSKRYRLKVATWVVHREPNEPSPRQLRSTDAAAQLAVDIVAEHDDDKEHFWVILVDSKLKYLMHTMVSMGGQTETVLHPREVFGPALREGATGLILIHNHPSGVPYPSAHDRQTTQRMVDAGVLLGAPGVIGSFFTVVEVAEIITFWPGLRRFRKCFKINDRI